MRAVVLAFLSVCGRLVEGAILLRAPGPTLALCEAIAFAVQFKNVDVMGQAIEQGTGQPLGAEHAGPFVERQVAGHDGCARNAG